MTTQWNTLEDIFYSTIQIQYWIVGLDVDVQTGVNCVVVIFIVIVVSKKNQSQEGINLFQIIVVMMLITTIRNIDDNNNKYPRNYYVQSHLRDTLMNPKPSFMS